MAFFEETSQLLAETLSGTEGEDVFVFFREGRGHNLVLGGDGQDQLRGLGFSPASVDAGGAADLLILGTRLDLESPFGLNADAIDRMAVLYNFEPGDILSIARGSVGAEAPLEAVDVDAAPLPWTIGLYDTGAGTVVLSEQTGDLEWDFALAFAQGNAAADVLAEREPALLTLTEADFTVSRVGDFTSDGETVLLRAGESFPQSQTVSAPPEHVLEVLYLYEALLDRDGAIDTTGFNYWVDQAEAGLTAFQIGWFMSQEQEFHDKLGDLETLSHSDIVDGLYQNVLGRSGEAAGVSYWEGVLATPEFEPYQAAVYFALADENVAQAAEYVAGLTEISDGVWDFA
ncbi:MAG: DUF4214 domain-containing protein [Pseudomonadota bacterium]